MNSEQRPLGKATVLLVVLAILVLWQLAGTRWDLVRLLVSTPTASFGFAVDHFPDVLEAFAVTAAESVAGLVVAFAFAVSTIIAGLYFSWFHRVLLPVVVVSQVIPIISLAPFFIMLFGLGITGKVAMAATMCFFPIFINFGAGITGIDQSVRNLAFIYAFSRTRTIFQIYVPLAVPSVFAGLRIASTLAVIGAIVAEFNGADVGLGKNLFLAAKRLEPELMIVSLACSSILGGALYVLLGSLERVVGYWYVPRRRSGA